MASFPLRFHRRPIPKTRRALLCSLQQGCPSVLAPRSFSFNSLSSLLRDLKPVLANRLVTPLSLSVSVSVSSSGQGSSLHSSTRRPLTCTVPAPGRNRQCSHSPCLPRHAHLLARKLQSLSLVSRRTKTRKPIPRAPSCPAGRPSSRTPACDLCP